MYMLPHAETLPPPTFESSPAAQDPLPGRQPPPEPNPPASAPSPAHAPLPAQTNSQKAPVPDVRRGRVCVRLSHATDLKAGDTDGLSDPYVVLKLGGRTETSAVVKKTLNPRFDWGFSFGFEDFEQAFANDLALEAWDHDFGVGLNDPLGHGSLKLATHRRAMLAGERVECSVPLLYRGTLASRPLLGTLASAANSFVAHAAPLLGKAASASAPEPAGHVFISLTWEVGNVQRSEAPSKLLLPKERKRPAHAEPSAAGRVKIFLSHATDLRAADKDGFSDPYIKLSLGKAGPSPLGCRFLTPTPPHLTLRRDDRAERSSPQHAQPDL